MAVREIKTTVALDGEKAYNKALSDLQRNMRIFGSEMKATTATFGANERSVEALTAKNQVLSRQIEQQKKIVESLKQAVADSAVKNKDNIAITDGYRIKLNNATAALAKMESELNENKIAISEFGQSTNEAEKKTVKWQETLKKVGVTLGKTVVASAKAAAVAVGAVTAAAGAAALKLGKEVVASFGELEQNVGGAEAVFGKYADSIKKSGEEAYKNMGTSQSEYLATANKMGALFQGSGLSQQKSLELTTQAMQRAADMASVMGIDTKTALDSVAGAAKGNFTMMDNLGVSMNATTIEAYAMSKGLDFTWSKATQAEKAEVAMQMFFEKTQQYAGNFARESEQTISGSIGMMKAATTSFVAGLGDSNANMTNLTQNMVNAFQSVVNNITPVLQNIVTALPAVIDTLVQNIGTMLPMLMATATDIFSQVLNLLVSLLPQLTPVAMNAIMTIMQAITQNLPMILQTANQIILSLVNGITTALPQIMPAAVQSLMTFVQGIIQALPQIMAAGIQMLASLIQGITQSIPQIIPAAVEGVLAMVKAIVDNLPMLLKAGLDMIIALVQGLVDSIPKIVEAMPKIIQAIIEYIITNLPIIIEAGMKIIIALVGGLIKAIPQLVASLPQIITAIVGGLMNGIGKIGEVGMNMIKGLWEGIKSMTSWLWDKLKGWVNDALGWIANLLGIHSPSRVMASMIGKPMAQGVAAGILGEKDAVQDALSSIIPSAVGLRANIVGYQAVSRRAMASIAAPSGAVNLSDTSVARLARMMKDMMIDRGDVVLTLNDREMGRYVRKVVTA